MDYLKYFFNPAHLFSLRPSFMSDRAVAILSIIFAGFIILAIIAIVKKRQAKSGLDTKGWQSLYHLGLTIGILGYVYVFFASQGVVLLAARFWLLIIGITAVVWGGFVGKYLMAELPRKKAEIKKQQEFKKYIP